MSLGSDFAFGALPVSQANANGFELLRQLSLELCLRLREEALAMRTSVAAKSSPSIRPKQLWGVWFRTQYASWTMNVRDTTSFYPPCHLRLIR